MKKPWSRCLLAVAAMIVVCRGENAFPQTSAPTRYVFEKIQQYLRNDYDIDLNASGVELDLLYGSVTLRGVVLRAASVPQMPALLRAQSAYLDFSVAKLLTGTLEVQNARIESPAIHFITLGNGRNNLPKAAAKSSGTGLLIAHAVANDGYLRIDDAQHGIHGTFPRWYLQIQGNPASPAYDFGFREQQPATLDYRGHTVPLTRVDVEASLQGSALEVHSAEISGLDSHVSLTGAIRNLSSPVFDLRLGPNLDIGRIARLAGLTDSVSGALSGTMSVSGPLSLLQVSGRLRGLGVAVEGYPRTDLSAEGRALWNGAAGRLVIPAFAVNSARGSFAGSASLGLRAGAGRSIVKADVKSFDVAPLSRRINHSVEIASRATGTVTLQWTGPPTLAGLAGSARLRLIRNRRIPGRNILPVSGLVDATLGNNRLDAKLQSAEALGAGFRGNVVLLSFASLEAHFSGDTPEISSTLTQLSDFVGAGGRPLVGLGLAGRVQFTASISGTMERPRVAASADAPALQIGRLTGVAVKADADIAGARIGFKTSALLPQQQLVLAQGTIDSSGRTAVLDLYARADEISVPAVVSILDSRVPAAGTLRATLHLSGALNDLTGTGSVTGSGLALYQEPMGNLAADFRVNGSTIQTTRFILLKNPRNPSGDLLTADFVYNLDSGQYSLQANGKELVFHRMILPGGTPVGGVVNLTASGTGTIENPTADASLQVTDTTVRDQFLGPITATASLRNQSVALDARAPRFGLTSMASIGIRAPYPADARVELTDFDLSLLGLRGPDQKPVTGRVDAGLTGSGELSDLDAAQATARVQRLQLTVAGQQIYNRGAVEAQYRRGSFEISPATIVAGNSSVQLAGTLPLVRQAPAGRLRAVARLDVAQIVQLIPVPPEFGAAGELNADLLLEGTLRALDVSGTVALAGGFLRDPELSMPVTDISLAARFQNGDLVLDQAAANWASARIAASGTIPLGLLPRAWPVRFRGGEGPARFTLHATDLTLEATGRFPQGVAGVISVTVSGEAQRVDIRAITASAVFDQLSLKINRFPLNQVGRSTVYFRDGVISIGRFLLQGPDTVLQAAGTAALFENGLLAMRVSGSVDAKILSLITQQLKADGNMRIQLALNGTRSAPDFSGFLELRDGQASVNNPRLGATNLNLRLDLSRNRITIQTFAGSLNGGSFNAGGNLELSEGTLNNVDIDVNLRDVYLDYPQGLNSIASGNITAKSSDRSIVIGGTIRVLESSYRRNVDFASQIVDYLRAQEILTIGPQVSPLLSRIRFNLAVRTETPVVVNNNMAKVAADVNMKLVGTYYQPSVVGRVNLEEGGQIYLNERTYAIESGVVNFTNQSHIEPNVNIEAETSAGGYDITLRLTGTPQKLNTNLTSDPPLSQPDIISVLLTGQVASTQQMTAKEKTQIVETQAFSLIAGQAGQELSRAAGRAFGLSTLRLQQSVISSELTPGPRLTIGEDVTRSLTLEYSANLLNSADQIWAAQYDITRQFTTQVIRQPDSSYRFGFNHDFRFGGAPDQARTKILPKTVAAVEFQGGPLFSDKTLMNKLRVKPGHKFEFFKLQKGIERLQDFYAKQNRFQAQVRFDRVSLDHTVKLDFLIQAGPTVDFAFEGMPVSGSVRKKVEQAWRNGVFDRERLDDAVAAIRTPLLEQGYLQSTVTHTIEEGLGRRLVRFHINPGQRFTGVDVVFPGSSGISASDLRNALDAAKMRLQVFTDPQAVASFLTRYYQEYGYLQAKVSPPEEHLNASAGTGQVAIPVHEGPRFTIGSLNFSGNHAFSYDQLWSLIPISSGSNYDPKMVSQSITTLDHYYYTHGYNDAVVTLQMVEDARNARANITFEIHEGKLSIIRDIVIQGNYQTSDEFVLRQLTFKSGDALDYDEIGRTRQFLYDTRVYAVVDFEIQDMKTAPAGSNTRNVRVAIQLREIAPYRLQYGGYFDTDRGPGGIIDLANRNVLGQAADVGIWLRYDSDLQEARLYFSQPRIHRLYLKTNGLAFARHETRPGFSANSIGFSLFQQKQLHQHWVVDYGYRYDHVRWNGIPPDPTLYVAQVPVASLAATFTRDTRDSVLDATRGSFNSQGFEFGPKLIGSEIGFWRYFGQYFRYVPLNHRTDREGRLLPATLVYAGAVRLGLSEAFAGQSIITPELFFAGGGTSMRGFDQDLLGPIAPDGRPLGGQALLLLNNEIRFPIAGIFQGVGFLDIGNVYPTLSDFDLGNLRYAVGPGLRIKTKFVLLRFDYGFKLNRRGESPGAFYFSIGQAF